LEPRPAASRRIAVSTGLIGSAAKAVGYE